MTDLDRAARSKDVAIGPADLGWGSTALFGSCQPGGLSRMPVRLDLRLVPRALLVLLGLAVLAWIAYKGSQDSRVFWVVTLNGLTLAALFFVVSAGFTLIFGLMRVVNMAHGLLYLLAGYIAFTLQGNWYGVTSNLLSGTQATLTSWVVPMIIATIVIGVAGVLMQQVFLRWNQGQDLRQGMIIRAGVDDRSMVSALGVNIQLVFAGAFFVGALLAGLAGVLGGTMIAVQPGNDSAFLLDSLIVVIIGGMGSLLGAAIGSVALGLVSAYADVYLKFGTTDLTNYAILLTFILVVAVLAVRPLGLFGRPA